MTIKFYDLNDDKYYLKFVVICAMFQSQWLFVRHKDRQTWEIPGGHIEANEKPDDAAARELKEESGATKFYLSPVCDYSVENSKGINFGRLYFARIEELEELQDFEIAEIVLKDELPSSLTYNEIQPFLFKKVKDTIFNKDNC